MMEGPNSRKYKGKRGYDKVAAAAAWTDQALIDRMDLN